MVERKFKTIYDVICPFCGTLCDDLEVDVAKNEVIEVRNGCQIGTKKFFSSNPSPHRYQSPLIKENGSFKEVSWEDAIDKAATLLTDSKRPLLYGFSSTECEAQSRGVELAELLGGVLDNTASVCHGPTLLAEQDVGVPTSTLGEYKNRADLVIFWGSNPVHAHPRHLGRYSEFVRGYFRKDGRNDRYIVVIDPRNTHTAQIADLYVKVNPNEDYELLNAMRALLRGVEPDEDEISGVPIDQVKKLVDILKNCNYGVIFFGMGLTQSLAHHRNIDTAICLTRELNDHTKFLITPMRGHYNVTGANQVFTWNSGYGYSVDFSRGYPRYNPGEFSAVELLIKDQIDTTLVVASDPASNFPAPAAKKMFTHPLIVIEPHETPTSAFADVILPPAIAGIETEGTAYRMDSVPLRLRKVKDAPGKCLADREILEKLIVKIKEKKGVQ
ncbi:MAG: formylmethanofuran dehydrogenase subunit B [Candidatus Lokiarchaeota archaeon]|nr:formylmethanofuran dehydrogenase subunit B [Candidatus Lokiarchaeota archaeon]MBD3342113.1 formylmethanofuran dehydrogenase subunit B [Candidatus Lokiarchaeota archaeon]